MARIPFSGFNLEELKMRPTREEEVLARTLVHKSEGIHDYVELVVGYSHIHLYPQVQELVSAESRVPYQLFLSPFDQICETLVMVRPK